MFRISRYALAHSFAQKHRFHRSRSPLRSLFNLCFWTFSLSQMSKRKLAFILPWREKVREANEILHQFISTNFEHLLIGCDSAIRASSIAFALHDNYSTRVQYPKWTIKSYTFLKLLFYLSCFIFSANYLNINHFKTWNIRLQCFTFSFNVSYKKHNGSEWSLPLCFDIAPTVFWNRSLSVFVFLPQCFWNEIKMRIFNHMPTR